MSFGYAVVSGAQVNPGGDAVPKTQPGTLMAYKSGEQWSIVQYVKADGSGWTKGQSVVRNLGATQHYGAKAAATGDANAPIAGIALSSVASDCYGWIAVKGYVENALVSKTVASGDYLVLGGSSAGQLTPTGTSSFFNATNAGSSKAIVALANSAFATGLGPVTLIGFWGV